MSFDEFRAISDRVARVLELAEEASEPEAKTDLACLACILTSALIEVACRQYVARFVEKRASRHVQRYVARKLYQFQNAKTEYVEELLGSFEPELAQRFLTRIGERGKDALDSIVSNKNNLVHGKGVGLGLDTMKRYHKDVLMSLEVLRSILTDPAS